MPTAALARHALKKALRQRALTSVGIQILFLASLFVGHVLLGPALLPQWIFNKYPGTASLFLEGELSPEQVSDVSPLYLFLNVLFSPSSLRGLQSWVGAASILAVFFLAKKIFGSVAAFVAALLWVSAAPLYLYEATLEPDLWTMVLNTAALMFLAFQRRWALASAGAALGLSAAFRPSILLFVPLALPWLAWEKAKGERVREIGIIALPFLLCWLVPPSVLSAKSGSKLSTTMSVGQVAEHGNRPESYGITAQPAQFLKFLETQLRAPGRSDYYHSLSREAARASEGANVSAFRCEYFWLKKLAEFAGRYPLALAELWGRKLSFFFLGDDWHDLLRVRVADAELRRWHLLRGNSLSLLAVAGIALLGFLALRKEASARRAIPLLLYLFALVATGLIFYVSGRYRVTALPALSVLAGAWIQALLSFRRDAGLSFRALVCGAIVFLLTWTLPFIRTTERLLQRGFAASQNTGAVVGALRAGQTRTALTTFMSAQAAFPFILFANNWRGIPFSSPELAAKSVQVAEQVFGTATAADQFLYAELLRRAGRCEEALPMFSQLGKEGVYLSIYDMSFDPHLSAAACHRDAQQPEQAREQLALGLKQKPGMLEGLAQLIALRSSLGEDISAARAELFALHDVWSARFALARAANDWGQYALAKSEVEALLQPGQFSGDSNPSSASLSGPGLFEHARALTHLDRHSDAFAEYQRAVRNFPEYPYAAEELDAAVRASLAPDPGVMSFAAEHAIRMGDFPRARSYLEQAEQLYASIAMDALERGEWETHRDRVDFVNRVLAHGGE